MKIKEIKINHLNNPLGFKMDKYLFIQAILENDNSTFDSLQKSLKIFVGDEVIFDSSWQNASALDFEIELELKPRTKYNVLVGIKNGDEFDEKYTSFETGLMGEDISAKWIGAKREDLHGIEVFKEITFSDTVQNPRLYITGLGLYEVYLDNQKIGDEFLAPGFTDYNYHIQVATYDLSPYIQANKKQRLSIILADGWYKGKFGLETHGGKENRYGQYLMTVAKLAYTNADGEEISIATDETWHWKKSQITHSGIYYGEDFDETFETNESYLVDSFNQPSKYLTDRISLPIVEHEIFSVVKLIQTPKGETILDFGQNFAGWITFYNRLPRGRKVAIEFGEILQNGEFYQDNLRSARATFTYVSDGKPHWVRPHFTYFGFRYAKLSEFDSIEVSDFKAVALYSDMPEIGYIRTSNPKVNRLFENVKWSQKSNFVDIPTDCPQRDERLGWTGDASIFAKTASYNMDTFQFFKKYSYDIAVEQAKESGRVPLYAPKVDGKDGGKAVWGDAATVIPWLTYLRTGDKAVLRQNITFMMSWVDWIHDYAKGTRNEYLWLDSDQLGDWLALDTEDIMHLKGKTPDDLIASAFYYQSCLIVQQAAKALNYTREEDYYRLLATKIKEAFLEEFFSQSGRPTFNTQTGLALCLYFNLYPEGQRESLTHLLVERINKDSTHLKTGFVGTPLLLPALSNNKQEALAVSLFLNEDFPSWLYAVNMGATTIWERWDSVDTSGKIADNGMNSLNHYSSGSVMEWAYEYLLGFKKFDNHQLLFAPQLTAELEYAEGKTQFAGLSVSAKWAISEKSHIDVDLSIPFGLTCQVNLPRTNVWFIGENEYANGSVLSAGTHHITYEADEPYVRSWTVFSPIKAYLDNKALIDELDQAIAFWGFLTLPQNVEHFKNYSLAQLSSEMKGIGFTPLSDEELQEINRIFAKYAD